MNLARIVQQAKCMLYSQWFQGCYKIVSLFIMRFSHSSCSTNNHFNFFFPSSATPQFQKKSPSRKDCGVSLLLAGEDTRQDGAIYQTQDDRDQS